MAYLGLISAGYDFRGFVVVVVGFVVAAAGCSQTVVGGGLGAAD